MNSWKILFLTTVDFSRGASLILPNMTLERDCLKAYKHISDSNCSKLSMKNQQNDNNRLKFSGGGNYKLFKSS